MRIFVIAGLLALAACSSPEVPAAKTTVASPGAVEAPGTEATDDVYLDDRSNAQNLIRSYYNAINRKEYARAWSYWKENSEVQPYEVFKDGFANTKHAVVTFGAGTSEGAAGNLYSSQHVALHVTNDNGTSEFYTGCYVAHISQPAVQDMVPFKPLGIRSAAMNKVASMQAASDTLSQPCEAN